VVAELRRGINLAGVLDRRDDRPGWPLRPEHLAAIAGAGFTAVRLPVR
jgi:endoglucanase